MLNTAVIYRSKYGAARIYAQWLKEMLSCPAYEADKIKAADLSGYDTLVFAGGIYAGGVSVLPFLKKNINILADKKIAVLAVGASPYDEKAIDSITAQNMKGPLSSIPLFYGRGAWDESRMTFIDRSLCKMMKKSIAKKAPSEYEPWMSALMEAQNTDVPFNWTDQQYLSPLLAYIHD